MRVLSLFPSLCLCACAELPPLEGTVSSDALAAPAPVILPLEDLLMQAALPPRAEPAQDALRQRGTRLRGVALPQPATGDLEMRARRLRERADALRNAAL